MNCPRCGEPAMLARTLDGGVLVICHACRVKQERDDEQQARDRIRDAVIEKAETQQRKDG